jgi:hypothetical protein
MKDRAKLTADIIKALASGDFTMSRHFIIDRMDQRNISKAMIQKAAANVRRGIYDNEKDNFRIEGKVSQDTTIRIIADIDDHGVLVVTAVRI